jgi:hypothetical protein
VVNNQNASVIDSQRAAALCALRAAPATHPADDLRFSDRDILVLGAGGFTLSHREPLNRYTYVDIDPAIRAIAERDFLREPARGEFIATDARRFVIDTTRRFDAIVVDVYSARTSIPGHLVTREFWRDTRRALKPGGVMLANLILDGQLASPYARNLLATIESAYGRCAVEVLYKSAPAATSSSPASPESSEAARIYADERNLADIDSARSPFDQTVVEFPGPLARQKLAHLFAPDREFGAVAPARVFGVNQHDPIGIARIPGILRHAHFLGGGFRGKGWHGGLCFHDGSSKVRARRVAGHGEPTQGRQICLQCTDASQSPPGSEAPRRARTDPSGGSRSVLQ